MDLHHQEKGSEFTQKPDVHIVELLANIKIILFYKAVKDAGRSPSNIGKVVSSPLSSPAQLIIMKFIETEQHKKKKYLKEEEKRLKEIEILIEIAENDPEQTKITEFKDEI